MGVILFLQAQFSWVQFSAFINDSHDETAYKCTIHVMFNLFPNVSNMLEQTCILKLSVIQEPTALFVLAFPTTHTASIHTVAFE